MCIGCWGSRGSKGGGGGAGRGRVNMSRMFQYRKSSCIFSIRVCAFASSLHDHAGVHGSDIYLFLDQENQLF